jgi:hypothetical protein
MPERPAQARAEEPVITPAWGNKASTPQGPSLHDKTKTVTAAKPQNEQEQPEPVVNTKAKPLNGKPGMQESHVADVPVGMPNVPQEKPVAEASSSIPQGKPSDDNSSVRQGNFNPERSAANPPSQETGYTLQDGFVAEAPNDRTGIPHREPSAEKPVIRQGERKDSGLGGSVKSSPLQEAIHTAQEKPVTATPDGRNNLPDERPNTPAKERIIQQKPVKEPVREAPQGESAAAAQPQGEQKQPAQAVHTTGTQKDMPAQQKDSSAFQKDSQKAGTGSRKTDPAASRRTAPPHITYVPQETRESGSSTGGAPYPEYSEDSLYVRGTSHQDEDKPQDRQDQPVPEEYGTGGVKTVKPGPAG